MSTILPHRAQAFDAAAYTLPLVQFQSGVDGLYANSGLSMGTATKSGIASLWFKADSTWPSSEDLLVGRTSGGTERFRLYFSSSNRLACYFDTSSGSTALSWVSAVDKFAVDTLYHLLLAWDLANTTFYVFLNGVELTDNGSKVANNATPDSFGRFGIPTTGTSAANLKIGDVYFNTSEYLNPTTPANLAKFYPATSLGATGQLPTGSQPAVCLSGNAAVWNAGTNKGYGGNLTMTGAVTDV